MSVFTFSPKDFVLRALRDHRAANPDEPYMALALLASQLKVPEEALMPLLEQLHGFALIELHPMWPTVREIFVGPRV